MREELFFENVQALERLAGQDFYAAYLPMDEAARKVKEVNAHLLGKVPEDCDEQRWQKMENWKSSDQIRPDEKEEPSPKDT